MAKRTVYFIKITLFLVLGSSCIFAQQNPSHPSPKTQKTAPPEPSAIAALLKDSLVLIETQDKAGRQIALGSGFFIDKHTILTNAHMLKWAHSATVKIVKDGVRVSAQKVLTMDRLHDLCTFTVDYAGIPVKTTLLTPQIGDRVYVLGNPLGLEATFSSGMVTAIRTDAIQMDAPISHGSSGGPVANGQGEVIGVSKSSMSEGQNLNFAVPLPSMSHVVDNLPIEDAGRMALTDRDFFHLSGPVKSVSVWESVYRSDGELAPPELLLVQEYDQHGGIILVRKPAENGITNEWIFERGDDTLITSVRDRKGTDLTPPTFKNHAEALALECYRHPLAMEQPVPFNPGRTNVYDDFGNVIEMRRNGVLLARKTYDEPGLPTEHFELDPSGNVKFRNRYQYEFDAQGNWIKQYATQLNPAYHAGSWFPLLVQTREITYW